MTVVIVNVYLLVLINFVFHLEE